MKKKSHNCFLVKFLYNSKVNIKEGYRKRANKVKNDAITSRDENFAQWYTDVCRKAELMDYSSVKGFIIYRPYGYALWEMIQAYMDKKFKETGHENGLYADVDP